MLVQRTHVTLGSQVSLVVCQTWSSVSPGRQPPLGVGRLVLDGLVHCHWAGVDQLD